MIDSDGKGFQTFVHSIEQGKFAPLVKGIVAGVVLLGITLMYLFIRYPGFATSEAMDQAQISRSLMDGGGFSTKYIRPMALWQMNRAEKKIPADNFPDFTQPPLFPALNVLPLLLVKGNMAIAPDEPVFNGDRAIAGFSVLLFFAAGAVGYFVARRLFDAPLALLGVIIILIADILWQFALSGLAHMLLLLLFMVVSWVIVRAIEDQEEPPEKKSALRSWGRSALIGVLFALMTLSHWLACWLFIGYLFFAFFYFRPRVLPLASILAFAAVLTPWIVRNMTVCGHPFGLALYPVDDDTLTRSLDPDFANLFYGFWQKMRLGIVAQMGNLLSYFGLNLAAGAFFLSLFHPFKRKPTAKFRWCLVAMWVLAVVGMAAYGPIRGPVSNLQLHSLFIPLFVFYGLAFLLVLWNRLGFQHPLMRLVFNTVIVFLCAIPMLLTLFSGSGAKVNWPPYVPPYIAFLEKLYKPDEAVCSDMPWAVAWYANRKCLLLPDTPKTMIDISDYEVMGAPIRGLFLTPITGNLPFMKDMVLGDYKAWTGLRIGLITNQKQVIQQFPLHAVTGFMDGQVVLFSDEPRWQNLKPVEPAKKK